MSTIPTEDLRECHERQPGGWVERCEFEGCNKDLFFIRCPVCLRKVAAHSFEKAIEFWEKGLTQNLGRSGVPRG